ncbi:hypothetical protein H7Y29_02995 [Microbacteriaceae bacterium]|nr:hypothetical protein [Candidatus Saccharibacteria bacterium]
MDQSYQSDGEMLNSTAASSSSNIVGFLFSIVMVLALIGIIVLLVTAMWKLYAKAGKPGWTSIVPFYNTYIMVELAGRPVWWFAVILLVPFVGTVLSLIVIIDFVKAYGKSTGYGVLSWFFPYITFPIMAFDKNTHYIGNGSTDLAQQAAYQQPAAIAPEIPAQSADKPGQPPFIQ